MDQLPFPQNEAIIADGAAFDLVRASVNLVLAGLLIALGTSLKLPLSTTYVTFMVAMGTSLADRAWGRDSAVYRITGVLSVIGGWFITAGAAFTICFFVALVLHYGGNISIIALIGIAIFILIRSQVMYKKRKAKEKGNETLKQLMQTADSEEALQLMRKHTREELAKVLEYAETNFELTVTSFIHENLRGLRRAMGSTKFEKQLIKQMKRTGTVAMCRLDNNTVLEKDSTTIKATTSPANWCTASRASANRVLNTSTITSTRSTPFRKVNSATWPRTSLI